LRKCKQSKIDDKNQEIFRKYYAKISIIKKARTKVLKNGRFVNVVGGFQVKIHIKNTCIPQYMKNVGVCIMNQS